MDTRASHGAVRWGRSRAIATIRDIARYVGVSPATVSRALHDADSPFVSRVTRERVQAAAAELGYVPNATGRALATGRTHLVSLWINNPYTPFYAEIGRLLHAESERRGYHPVVRSMSTQSGQPARWEAADSLADGILAVDVREPIQLFLRNSPSFRRPLVGMGALCLDTIDHVSLDLYAGAVEAVEHLVSTRPGRIVCLAYAERDPRTRAYLDVMRQAGREPVTVLIPDETRASNRRFVREYVREQGCPDALFCHNDDVAIAAYRGLVDQGVRVPEDVALVGCDGIEDTEYLPVPISTVVSPVGEMTARAWQFLDNRMAEPGLPRQSAVLCPRLHVRQSSGGRTTEGR